MDDDQISKYYYPLLYSHFALTSFMLFGWVSENPTVLNVLVGLLSSAIVLFFIFNGCILSKLEKKLSSGSDYTVIDPVLAAMNMTTSRQHRTSLTILLFAISLFIAIYKLRKPLPTKTNKTENEENGNEITTPNK